MNVSKLELWHLHYTDSLEKAMNDHPGRYMLGVTHEQISARALATIKSRGIGAINIPQSIAWKATAKKFGIKNTYKAWGEWFNS